MPATGPSFRDATRVAGANPPIWRDIYRANRDALLDASSTARSRACTSVRAALAAGDDAGARGLARRRPREQRRALLERRPGRRAGARAARRRCRTAPASSPTSRWRSARAGVNIADMALSPVARQQQRRSSPCGSPRRSAEPRPPDADRRRSGIRRSMAVNDRASTRPGRCAARLSPPAGQVDLAPRRAARRDERRAGRTSRNYLDADDTQLDARRRRGARRARRAPRRRRSSIRGRRPARGAPARRRRSTSATPAR